MGSPNQSKSRVVRNTNQVVAERMTRGEHAADAITRLVGSWRFIIIQSCMLATWLVINALGWAFRWDPYPFILLNLVLSFQAAFTAPIIMMSQNRQTQRDRLDAELDFEINRKAELEIEELQLILGQLTGEQWETLLQIQREQLEILREIQALSRGKHPRSV